MKKVFSILLIFITIIYILPVKQTLAGTHTVSITDTDEEKNENNKKECWLFSFTDKFVVLSTFFVALPKQGTGKIPVLIHTVETPPPDLV